MFNDDPAVPHPKDCYFEISPGTLDDLKLDGSMTQSDLLSPFSNPSADELDTDEPTMPRLSTAPESAEWADD